MSNRTPTAEEVLGLYVKWNKTEEEFDEFRMQCRDEGEVHDFAIDVINDKEKFETALVEWQAAQGPVTREWFEERFGGFHPGIEIVFDRENGPELVCRKCGRWIKLDNPTRNDIETLVRVLGGESCG